MKRIFMSAVTLLLVTAAVQAQTDSTNGQRHEHRQMQQDRALDQLNLSADQKAKMKAMHEDFKKQADDLKAQNLSDDDRRTKMQALRQQQKEQMDAILTPEQKQQWEKLRDDRREQMNDRKNGNGDSTGKHDRQSWNHRKGERNIQKELNLTSDQQAKMKEIRTDFKSKAETLRNDKTLTEEQRHTKIHALMQQQQEQMKTVLTKEQQEKWQQLRSERRKGSNS